MSSRRESQFAALLTKTLKLTPCSGGLESLVSAPGTSPCYKRYVPLHWHCDNIHCPHHTLTFFIIFWPPTIKETPSFTLARQEPWQHRQIPNQPNTVYRALHVDEAVLSALQRAQSPLCVLSLARCASFRAVPICQTPSRSLRLFLAVAFLASRIPFQPHAAPLPATSFFNSRPTHFAFHQLNDFDRQFAHHGARRQRAV